MRNDLKSVPKVPDTVASGRAAITVNVRPLHDRVIVKRVPREETSKGGILIPDTAKEKPQEAQVVAVGPGRRDDNGRIVPMGVEKGDRILFGKYSGSDVQINGEEHLILQETDILGVIAQ